MSSRFYLSIPDTQKLADAGPLAFRSRGSAGIAEELEAALRTDVLYKRWAAGQDDPEDIDVQLSAIDPTATVVGEQKDLHVDLVVTTSLTGDTLRHRLRLLAGSYWQLRDVTAA